LLSTSG